MEISLNNTSDANIFNATFDLWSLFLTANQINNNHNNHHNIAYSSPTKLSTNPNQTIFNITASKAVTTASTGNPNSHNHITANVINETRFIRSFSYFTDQNLVASNIGLDCLNISAGGGKHVHSHYLNGQHQQTPSQTSTLIESFNHNELLKEKFNDATVIISVIILVLINIVVIFGNILVILSVFVSNKLRTVTNFFIVSLAVADFLVGIAVLPYSLTFEILDTWIFGEMWCLGWLVIDVWMCTASILNLCAISVDRYMAVTRPVRYRSLMTAKRAKFIIAGVWIISFIICFPPLLLGKPESFSHHRPSLILNNNHNDDASSAATTTSTTTATASDPLSTYHFSKMDSSANIPLIKDTITRSHPRDLRDSKDDLNDGDDDDDDENDENDVDVKTFQMNESSSTTADVTIDVIVKRDIQMSHRPDNDVSNQPKQTSSSTSSSKIGSSSAEGPSSEFRNEFKCKPKPVQCALFKEKSYVIYSALGSFFIPMFVMIFFYWRIYLVAIRTSRALKRGYRVTKSSTTCEENPGQERLTLRIHRGYAIEENVTTLEKRSSIDHEHMIHSGKKDSNKSSTSSDHQHHPPNQSRTSSWSFHKSSNQTETALTTADSSKLQLPPPNSGTFNERNGKNRSNSSSSGCQTSNVSLPPLHQHQHHSSNVIISPSSSSREGSSKNSSSNNKSASGSTMHPPRPSKRTSKYQAKRFQAETKAAKTVGIIVGGFIVCWLPFFTVYLTRAFCDDCIPELLFSIFFWLGYCNSMINPCIYGLFSRDFRRAFKNIICRCRFREETSVSSLIRQIHMPTFFEDMPEEMAKHESQEY